MAARGIVIVYIYNSIVGIALVLHAGGVVQSVSEASMFHS